MDTPQDVAYNFRCNSDKEIPSFSSPFLQFQCPMDPNAANPFAPDVHPEQQGNELLLKDPVLRRLAMVNQLDCNIQEAHTRRENVKGPNYGRASGAYYRARHQGSDSQSVYCRELDNSMPNFAPAPNAPTNGQGEAN